MTDKPEVKNAVGVFVGGTSGIGEYTAYTFCQRNPGSTVYIVGRSQARGDQVVAKCKEHGASSAHFVKGDMTLLSEAVRVGQEIRSAESKINSLQYSAGSPFITGEATSEGLDSQPAIYIYSRVRLVEELTPLVEKAAELGEPARINNVLNSTQMSKYSSDMVPLGSGMQALLTSGSTFLTLWTVRYASLHPTIAVIHTSPGVVDTPLKETAPWYIRWLFKGFSIAFDTPEKSGQKMYSIVFDDDQFAQGALFADAMWRTVKQVNQTWQEDGLLEKDYQDAVYAHIQSVIAAK